MTLMIEVMKSSGDVGRVSSSPRHYIPQSSFFIKEMNQLKR